MQTRIKTQAASHTEIANIAFQTVTIMLVGLFSLVAVVRFLATAMA